MCGICGYVSSNKLNEKAMLDALQHRGPDHCGSYSSFQSEKNIFLGHTRLSIIDLSDNGNQPMSSPDGSIQLISNGEIYNYKTIRKELLNNVQFKSKTDTEVLLRLYEQKGISCIDYIQGDFAVAILDGKKRTLYLIRDRMGVKPLYYFLNSGNILFASEINSILKSGIHPCLDEDKLENFFVFKYVPQNNTIFRNIKRVPPAHILSFDLQSGKLDLNRFWSPAEMHSKISYPDAKEKLDHLLEESVTQRLTADVPIGNFLSGGLDSSIIASFIKEHHDIRHYCAVKNSSDIKHEGTTADQHYAGLLAKNWGLQLDEIPISTDDLNPAMITRLIKHSDDLIADSSQIPSLLISQKAAKHSRVLLSGMGADELFLGYATHQLSRMALITDKLPQFMSNLLLKYFQNLSPGKGKFKAYKRWLHKFGRYFHSGSIRYGLFSIVGDFDNAVSLFNSTQNSSIELLNKYFDEKANPFDALWKFESENFLVKNLHYTDRMAMAHSIEVRVPFLDHRVVEFARNIPVEYKMKSFFKPKRILKDTFSNRLPSEIIRRRKAGFGMPLRSILSNRKKTDELIDIDFFGNFNIFNTRSIQQIISNHTERIEDNSSLIFALLVFQYWYKEYIGT